MSAVMFSSFTFQEHDIHVGSVLLDFVISMILRKRSSVIFASGESFPNRSCMPMSIAML